MKRTVTKTVVAIAVCSGISATIGYGNDELLDGFIVDTRIRFEHVDQEWGGDADALTFRARLGFESQSYEGFKFLVEGEFSEPASEGDFDAYPGAQGTAGKAVIPDGPTRELNRAQVAYSNESGFTSVIGRQRIILGNARYIGNVGWRQNEQTYDAATVIYAPDEKSQYVYAYIDQVNRIFGSEANAGAQRRLDTEAHAANAIFKPDAQTEFGAYAYLLGVDTAPAASSDTFGVYYFGKSDPSESLQLTTRLEYAQQSDNSHSPVGADYSLNYWLVEFGGKEGDWSGSIGYEVLEGDGTQGFSTPLATLHAFNGWADAFLATPANGLIDLYASVGYKFNDNVNGKIVWHDFEAESGSAHYGEEIDAVISWKLNDRNKLTTKLAYYNGDVEGPGLIKIDRTKFWIQIDSKY